mgnify:FL=1|tara:strand:+ start:4215 stop:6908 length:2694 start_codon:yes stop_codon:yes gene_type:complete
MARNNVVFSEISIKAQGSSEYINVLQNFQASSTFGGMSIDEGLFEGGISGFIILNDPNPNNDSGSLPSITNLAKTGSMIRFSFGTQVIESGLKSFLDGLSFYVYNVSIVSDISPGIAKLGSSQSVTYRLEFASYESTSINYETRELEEDYVGTISDFVESLASSDQLGILAPTPEDGITPIQNTTQVEPEIVPTYNGLWIKNRQSLYPWGKEKSIPSINTIIRSSLNYAIPALGQIFDDDGELEDRGTAQKINPSYVFYQSMPDGQWHLIPIGGNEADSLYKKNYIDGNEDAGYHTYRFTMDETVSKRIEMFKLIKSTDLLELQESGAFGSRYNLIEPNYRGLYNGITELDSGEKADEETVHNDNNIGIQTNTYYHDAMSVATHLKQDYVVYKYEDFNAVDEDDDSDSPLLGRKLPVGQENPAFSSLTDTVYGYFDSSYLYKPFPTMNDDYATSRGNKYMWQPMFDTCEFPLITDTITGEIGIKDIVDIRNNNKQCKLAYTVLADLKEQWNRYRYSVCCNSDTGGEFLALLVGATWGGQPQEDDEDPEGLDRNIIPYGLSAGNTVGHMFRYSFVEVETWPKALVPEETKADVFIEGAPSTQTYYEYLESIDINPANGEKKVYIPGNSGDDYSSKDGDDKPIANGLTFTFGLNPTSDGEQAYKVNQQQEMFVIPVGGGKRGLFSAYNTIEMTNNKAFTGAGINTKGFNYPSGFNLMEIGGMTAGSNSGEGTTPIPATYMGSIVRMNSINDTDLSEIKTRRSLAKLGTKGYCEDSNGNRTDAETEVECSNTPGNEWKTYGGTDAYTGPDIPDSVDGPYCSVTYLLNEIMGTVNLPTTFAGPPSKLYFPSADDKITIQRSDKNDRPITDNAAPQESAGITGSQTLFIFTAENDHDGKCTT